MPSPCLCGDKRERSKEWNARGVWVVDWER
jgi:hypothetical protein